MFSVSVFTLYTVCHQQEEPQGCSSQHLPCTSAETTHDMLTDLHQSFVLNWSIPRGSPGMGEQDSSLFFSVCSSTFLYTSVNPSPTCNTETTSVYLGTKNEHLPKSMLITNESSHSACSVSRCLIAATELRAAIIAGAFWITKSLNK